MPIIRANSGGTIDAEWYMNTPAFEGLLGKLEYQSFYVKQEESKVEKINKAFDKIFLEIYSDPDKVQTRLHQFLNYVEVYANKL